MKNHKTPLLKEVLEWDVRSWSHAIKFWEKLEIDPKGLTVLDLGSRRGGLTYYFANQGAQVICSDLDGPSIEAKELINKHELSDLVRYEKIDATSIDLPDDSCDMICFKSILGGIGRDGNDHSQNATLIEIHRVLRPGGTLFFAENLRASFLHQYLRKQFVRWGDSWNYLTENRLFQILAPFEEYSLEFWGFWSAFGRNEFQRSFLSHVDSLIIPMIPQSQRYIVYGYAIKSGLNIKPSIQENG